MWQTEKVGLQINGTKTKYMHFNETRMVEENPQNFELLFDKVNSFKYLGVMISNQNTDELGIQSRLNAENK